MEIRNDIEEKLDKLLFNLDKPGCFNFVSVNALTEEELKYFTQRAAIGMAHDLYRNGVIEDFHADSCKDVILPDSAMKIINKDVCNNCYDFIMRALAYDPVISGAIIYAYSISKMYGHDWDAPTQVPRQLSRIRSMILDRDDCDWLDTGVELFVTHNETGKQFLMFFVFDSADFDEVTPYEMEEGPLEEETYTFEDFVKIMAEHYTIESFSLEYRGDLLDEDEDLNDETQNEE